MVSKAREIERETNPYMKNDIYAVSEHIYTYSRTYFWGDEVQSRGHSICLLGLSLENSKHSVTAQQAEELENIIHCFGGPASNV